MKENQWDEPLSELYRQYGFRKFRISKFEDYDLYVENKDFLHTGTVIAFRDADGSLKALKPDVTLSVMKNSRGENEKLYYSENVYREKNGFFREILQVGVESVGKIDAYAQAEVVILAVRSLELLSEQYVLNVSAVDFIHRVLCEISPEQAVRQEILLMVEQKNIHGIQALVQSGRLTAEKAAYLAALMKICAPLQEGLILAKQAVGSRPEGELLRGLQELSQLLNQLGMGESVRLDFSLVNSMDYYNGIIFQGFVPDVPAAVLFGGRYDKLPEKMGKRVGAIGFGIDLSMLEQKKKKDSPYDVDYVLLYKEQIAPKEMFLLAQALRQRGKSVLCQPKEVDCAIVRCKKMLDYREGMTAEEVTA